MHREHNLRGPHRARARNQRRIERSRNPRKGFTLVELLVAIVLLNVGLLALVGGSAALVRRHSILRMRSSAERMAASRLEQLAIAPCSATSGSLAHLDTDERWTVVDVANRVRELSASVDFPAGGARASVALRTRVAC